MKSNLSNTKLKSQNSNSTLSNSKLWIQNISKTCSCDENYCQF